jgi:hypothetical protein
MLEIYIFKRIKIIQCKPWSERIKKYIKNNDEC